MKTQLLALVLILTAFTLSSQKSISGKIKDDTGTPLFGASIQLKDFTEYGTITNLNGEFNMDIPEEGTTLLFRYIGYETKEINIGSSAVFNIVLQEDRIELDEIIISALGIEREKRSLGYGVDQIGSKELTSARSTNILNALIGKVSGVQIQSTGGNIGSSSKIIIRGYTSLSGKNAPLWIVDGVPINDNQFASSSRRSGNRDFGNGASVLNPDDIESISILKGAAATALYGSRAAAGAIIVTSKRGSSIKGVAKITVNSSFRLDDIFLIPDYQQKYASGSWGKYEPLAGGHDWGPRFVGQTVENLPLTGETGFLEPVEQNGIKQFFDIAHTAINNFSISDGSESMDYRLSFGAMNQKGLAPAARLDRYNISINTGLNHTPNLKSRIGIQYIKTNSEGTIATGANDPNILSLSSVSNILNRNLFKPWIDENGDQINQIAPITNNPFWIQYENRNDRNDSRILGNASLTFTPIEKLKFTGKVGYDYDQDNRFISNRKGTAGALGGNFLMHNINNTQFNVDIIGNYNTKINSDLGIDILGGINYNNRKFESAFIFASDLIIAELFQPSNASFSTSGSGFNEQALFGVYSSIGLNYKDFFSLTFTGRNDWSSTLPLDNNSYFFPSISAAFVFTDAIPKLIDNKILNFGKLRASYAEVGNDTEPYQLDFNFFPTSGVGGQYGLGLSFPFNGRLAYTKGNTLPPADLRPERQQSFEFGAELDFLNSRVGLDISYFNTKNKDQIQALPIPHSTGFSSLRANAGTINTSGFEISLDVTPINGKIFRWNSLINFSKADVKVTELAEGVERVGIASAFNSVQVVAELGGGFELFAIPFLRDPDSGRPIINPQNGTRLPGEAKAMGSVLPDFFMGFVNSLTYNNLSLNFTIDWRSGGIMKSSTVEEIRTGGLGKETLLNRGGTFIDTEGVIPNSDGTFRDNDIPVINAEAWWGALNNGSIAEAFIFDASFVKLREIAINYMLPNPLLERSFIGSLSIGVEARNVALLYSKVPHIDPEANLFGSASDGLGVERASVVSARSIGLNIRATF
jgi:TonB-linked SusC/RagA family outer membrane protein